MIANDLTVIPGILLFLIMIYTFFRVYVSWSQGYSWQKMDWYQRDNTSVVDFFDASEIGKREVTVDGTVCVEFYAYKDGLPMKTICQK